MGKDKGQKTPVATFEGVNFDCIVLDILWDGIKATPHNTLA